MFWDNSLEGLFCDKEKQFTSEFLSGAVAGPVPVPFVIVTTAK